jgi:hypothetical protein
MGAKFSIDRNLDPINFVYFNDERCQIKLTRPDDEFFPCNAFLAASSVSSKSSFSIACCMNSGVILLNVHLPRNPAAGDPTRRKPRMLAEPSR